MLVLGLPAGNVFAQDPQAEIEADVDVSIEDSPEPASPVENSQPTADSQASDESPLPLEDIEAPEIAPPTIDPLEIDSPVIDPPNVGAPTISAAENNASEETKPQKPLPKPAVNSDFGNLGDLPWNNRGLVPDAAPQPKATRVRDYFANVEDSEFETFFNFAPIERDGEAIIKIMYHMRRVGIENIEHLATDLTDVSPLLEDPKEYRVNLYRIRGTVTKIIKHELPPEIVEVFELKYFYEISMKLPNAPNPVVVFARRIPLFWRETLDKDVEYQAGLFGLFLQVGEKQGDATELAFMTDRMNWYANRSYHHEDYPVTDHQVLLSSLGMDIGLFDDARATNRKKVGSVDRECFYQMLYAVKQSNAEQLQAAADKRFNLAPYLMTPKQQHGRLVTLTGNVRRIAKLQVTDPDIQRRYNIDHYYQLHIFIDLGDVEIRLGKNEDGTPAPMIRNKFPLTCIVPSLPPELSVADDLNTTVQFTGFNYKLWAYKSYLVTSHNSKQRQPSPAFIGLEPTVVEYEQPRNIVLGYLVGAGFLTVIAGGWIAVVVFGRRDRRFQRDTMGGHMDTAAEESLKDLDAPADDSPDFSGLN